MTFNFFGRKIKLARGKMQDQQERKNYGIKKDRLWKV